ncbi:hypothetical protein NM688_g2536 [Phlebia brevispora]|uniref:Uncharacterized protein n=1 Tax=Phlebia brevispora TaxID=194682 RepID=A0ACC1T8J5_9APHY|nr:hypothetical protein NM688_g2536 [Phlebia brevispora]
MKSATDNIHYLDLWGPSLNSVYSMAILNTTLTTSVTRDLITRYTAAACFTCSIWDHSLTFLDEINYIWRAKDYLTKLSFILNRRTPGPCAISAVGHKPVYALAALMFSSVSLTNACIALRVYNMWEHGRFSTIVIWGGATTIYVSAAVFAILTIRWLHTNVYNPELHACFLDQRTWSINAVWIALLAFDVFILVMIVLNALAQPYRHGADVFRRLRRDGVIGFVVRFRLLSIVLTAILPPDTIFVSPIIQWVLNSVFLSRLILHEEKLKIRAVQVQYALPCDDHDQYELTMIVSTTEFGSAWY